MYIYIYICRKTTLVRQAARKVGRGVIYVDGCLLFYLKKIILLLFLVPSNTDKFGFAFARAIRFHFKEHLRLSTWIESKMFGSPPDEGIYFDKCLFFLVNELFIFR